MNIVDGERIGLRERKKRETRAALSWAAIRLTVQHGFNNVLVEDIAEAAGVSPRTFNNYFASKGEAIVARHLDRCIRVADELRRRPPTEPLWESLAQAALTQFDADRETTEHPVTDREQWVAGLRVMIAEPAIQGDYLRASAQAESAIAAAIAERTGTDLAHDLYPYLAAGVVLTASNVATQHWLRVGPDIDMQSILLEAFRQLAAGLPAP